MARLTTRQEQFVHEYLIDLNASAAARRAGYSSNHINANAQKLLQNTAVRARIDEALAERSRRTGVNQDRVIRELARLAFVNAPDVINMDEAMIRVDASPDDTAAIASVKVKRIPGEAGDGVEREIRLVDKLKALELLGKHLGMFSDRLAIDITGVKIIDDIGGEAE